MHILKTITKLPFWKGCAKEMPIFLPSNTFFIFTKLIVKYFHLIIPSAFAFFITSEGKHFLQWPFTYIYM